MRAERSLPSFIASAAAIMRSIGRKARRTMKYPPAAPMSTSTGRMTNESRAIEEKNTSASSAVVTPRTHSAPPEIGRSQM